MIHPKDCGSRMELATPRNRVNGLRVEVGTPSPRCFLKPPENTYGVKANPVSWLGSGGSVLAFGVCDVNDCPLNKVCDDERKKAHNTT